MSKRKQNTEDDGNESDVSLIDVDFDFFGPNPDVDYHAINRLLNQLFQADAEAIHAHQLTELILSQPGIGSTIKTDGEEADPYALLTVLNMHTHQSHPSIKAIADYALSKTAAADPPFHAALKGLLAQSQNHVGLIVCERLINMPVQVIPPMYRMLIDELKTAIDANEPFAFTHLLFISRTYKLSEEEESELAESRTSKKRKTFPQPTRSSTGVYSFHLEDEQIQQAASHALDYALTHALPRDKDAFGLDVAGRMMLVPADRLQALVDTMSEVYRPPGV
ncbi:hypothetical protein CONPUDRAFT_133729 [Coniophora puteana RWD-64-598 SS2]|uniref:Protein BCP1 n=1 Tax=Coniophora puteana (strain RWD-64-598) TaxID=741705 RepID=A0A5M3N5U5_CONPW|nr:uncharacterized protein CONPUDRAFT_133729 [Coniophora puteana RWD-64-598 SS2]EIW86231.1 hypothetical protein CONPUDRAFT_133729 [Coniophora puteana RWD-64-598 SS2]